MPQNRVAFIASRSEAAQAALAHLRKRYDNVASEQADVIVALGGDGFMLHCLHTYMDRRIPIYGMNRGSVGFLMNTYREAGLRERLQLAKRVTLHPLHLTAYRANGEVEEALAINEVAVTRDSAQAAKIQIMVDGRVRMEQLIADGVMVATAAGSTAYNLSAHGPIIPVGANLLALTPISAFRPRRWRGALLANVAHVRFDILEREKRPVLAVADSKEVRHPVRVEVVEDRGHTLTLLYDPEHNLEERILNEQFLA